VKLALVTGGRRRLGAAIADSLEAGGWIVARHSHVDDSNGAFVADLAEADAPQRLIDAIIVRFGTAPTLLVNNARDADAASLAAHHAINAQAPVLLALALVKAGQGGSIVNILDQRLRNPNGDQLSYTLSKAALDGATRTLAAALAPSWRVNAVAPGLTIPTGDYDTGQMERLAKSMPLGELPTPGAIADAVRYLASASSVTGQTIYVDGGASLKSYDRDFMHL
jgi:pteridine reductase